MQNNKPSSVFDSKKFADIIKDLYQLGKDTNDEKIMNQALKGAYILDEKKRATDFLQRSLINTGDTIIDNTGYNTGYNTGDNTVDNTVDNTADATIEGDKQSL